MSGIDDKTGAPAPAPDNISAEVVHSTHSADGAAKDLPRGFQPPEIIRLLTDEQREQLEKKLVRKIDLRILPLIIIMYILNYIDRYGHRKRYFAVVQWMLTGSQEQHRISQICRLRGRLEA
jgi:hypothetical protein